MAKWDLFSKRDKPLPDTFVYDEVHEGLRNQIIHIWRDTLGTIRRFDPYQRIHNIICREHGRLFLLVPNAKPDEDLLNFFLRSADTDIVLDIIETSFRIVKSDVESDPVAMSVALHSGGAYVPPAEHAVDELNHRFRENGVGYEFNWDANQLLCVKSMAIHQETVRPALSLLAEPRFETANQEYLEAHKHFRKGEYGDCLTECCKALESTIKIVCDQKGWGYGPRAAANELLQTYISRSGLPTFFQNPLILIATLRNRFDAHGGGTTPATVPEHLAKYSLHATASAIVLLVDAAK
jgi:hypothetical protein